MASHLFKVKVSLVCSIVTLLVRLSDVKDRMPPKDSQSQWKLMLNELVGSSLYKTGDLPEQVFFTLAPLLLTAIELREGSVYALLIALLAYLNHGATKFYKNLTAQSFLRTKCCGSYVVNTYLGAFVVLLVSFARTTKGTRMIDNVPPFFRMICIVSVLLGASAYFGILVEREGFWHHAHAFIIGVACAALLELLVLRQAPMGTMTKE